MRISDWSSDVCSSDLARSAARDAGAERTVIESRRLDLGKARDQWRASGFHQHVVQAFPDQRRITPLQPCEEQRKVRALLDQRMERIGIGQHSAYAPCFQIGSASGRERVCLYVKNKVVAG